MMITGGQARLILWCHLNETPFPKGYEPRDIDYIKVDKNNTSGRRGILRNEGTDGIDFLVVSSIQDYFYKIDLINPRGDLVPWDNLSESDKTNFLSHWNKRTLTESGSYVGFDTPWNWQQIGVEHMSGRVLRKEEDSFIEQIIVENAASSEESLLMNDLLNRGLLLRPGFKYGCRWRVYDGDLNESHAPWLIQPHKEAATTWEGVCLSVRLAEGVHKQWVCAIPEGDVWKYLRIQRWSPGKNSSAS